MHRVVVTGIGVVAPNGIGRREFCEAILEGRSGVGYIESFDTSGMPIKIAGEVRDFDVLPYLGEHNDEVLREWLGRTEAGELRVAGVLHSDPRSD